MALSPSRPLRDRVRHWISLDAAGVMRRLTERQDEMLSNFSRLRDREVLLKPLRSTANTVRFADLVLFNPVEQRIIHDFFEALDDLHWYLQYTTDMPGALELKLRAYVRVLEVAHERLVAALGAVSEAELDADFPT